MPSNPNATKVTSNDFEVESIAQATMCGIFTSIIARLRPNGSVSKPDKMLPSGCPMNETLASKCEDLIESKSLINRKIVEIWMFTKPRCLHWRHVQKFIGILTSI